MSQGDFIPPTKNAPPPDTSSFPLLLKVVNSYQYLSYNCREVVLSMSERATTPPFLSAIRLCLGRLANTKSTNRLLFASYLLLDTVSLTWTSPQIPPVMKLFRGRSAFYKLKKLATAVLWIHP